jgi:hypothetical protein
LFIVAFHLNLSSLSCFERYTSNLLTKLIIYT